MVQGVSEPVSQQITESLSNQITSLKIELKTRDETIAQMQARIDELTTEADGLEQYTRRNSARISGIAETDNEDVTAKVIDVINNDLELDPPLSLSEVDRVHRVGKPKTKTQSKSPGATPSTPPAPRPVLIKFATYRSRKRVMDLRSKLKRSNHGLFINEDLTRKRSELLYKARQLKRAHRIKGAWTADGKILILDTNSKVVVITSENDLRDY